MTGPVDLVDVREQADAWRAAISDLAHADDVPRADGAVRGRVEAAIVAGVAVAESLIGTGENDRI